MAGNVYDLQRPEIQNTKELTNISHKLGKTYQEHFDKLVKNGVKVLITKRNTLKSLKHSEK